MTKFALLLDILLLIYTFILNVPPHLNFDLLALLSYCFCANLMLPFV